MNSANLSHLPLAAGHVRSQGNIQIYLKDSKVKPNLYHRIECICDRL